MKNLSILGICLFLSITSLGQKVNKWKVTYESNFSKFRLNQVDFQLSTKGYKELPAYFNEFEEPYTSLSKFYINDSLTREHTSTQHNPYKTAYFRSNHFGIGTNIYTSKYLDVSHSVGVEFSRADLDYGTIRNTYEYRDVIDEEYETTTFTKSASIASFKKIRRLGLSYENAIRLKPTKKLSISLGVRQQLYFKYTDHLLTRYSSYVDSSGRYGDYYLCGTELGIIRFLGKINLYDKHKPSSSYDKTKRSMTFQYDLTLFVRPELVIGKSQNTSIFCNIGLTPVQVYGRDFRPENSPVWYGIGLSRVL